MTRIQVDLLGRPTSAERTMWNFRIVLAATLYIVVFNQFILGLIVSQMICKVPEFEPNDYWNGNIDDILCPGAHPWYEIIQAIRRVTAWAYSLYFIFLLVKIRLSIRAKYGIPTQCCKRVWPAEDVCCALCCTCCVVTQMARHTADYNTYRGVCCSLTGLPTHVPSIV